MRLATLTPMPHELRPLEHRQVLGNGRLGNTCIPRQRVDCLFTLPRELLEDRSTGRIGERAEHVMAFARLHTKTISIWLWVVNQNFARSTGVFVSGHP